jgi:hypothetical protein
MTPQITILLDSTNRPHAEAPGKNGARRKVDLPLDFAQNNPEIMSELLSQADEARAKIALDLRTTQIANIKYVAKKHGDRLVHRIWHDGELKFGHSLARKPEPIPNSHTPKPRGRIIDIGE